MSVLVQLVVTEYTCKYLGLYLLVKCSTETILLQKQKMMMSELSEMEMNKAKETRRSAILSAASASSSH